MDFSERWVCDRGATREGVVDSNRVEVDLGGFSMRGRERELASECTGLDFVSVSNLVLYFEQPARGERPVADRRLLS